MSGQPTADWAKGRWPGILIEMGVPATCLTGKHGPCPICSGTDRFRFDDKEGRGTFYCSNCGAGDGFDLLTKFLGIDFKMAAAQVDKLRGKDLPKEVFKPEVNIEQRRSWLNTLWAESTRQEIWRAYLTEWRGLAKETVDMCVDIRGHIGQLDTEDDTRWPTMVTLVRDLAGRPVTIHRTFMKEKATGKEWVKKFAPSIGDGLAGASAQIIPGDEMIVVGEGIETTLAGWEWLQRQDVQGNIGARAALTANGLAGLFLPQSLRGIWICADRDRKFAGQAAAYELARRISAVKDPPSVFVLMPREDGTDMLDVLLQEKGKVL